MPSRSRPVIAAPHLARIASTLPPNALTALQAMVTSPITTHAKSAHQGPSWTQLKQSQPATRALHHAQHAQETQPHVTLVSLAMATTRRTKHVSYAKQDTFLTFQLILPYVLLASLHATPASTCSTSAPLVCLVSDTSRPLTRVSSALQAHSSTRHSPFPSANPVRLRVPTATRRPLAVSPVSQTSGSESTQTPVRCAHRTLSSTAPSLCRPV